MAYLEQFFTDPKLAEPIVRWARVEPGMSVLEPSAGSGEFVAALLAVGARVVAVELDPKLVKALLRRFAWAVEEKRLRVVQDDFLTFTAPEPGAPTFDLAVMNPPYGSRGKTPPWLGLKHVAHALRFAPRVVGLLASSFEYGVQAQKRVFAENETRRRVVLVNRPEFHGPDDKDDGARRDYGVFEVAPKTEPIPGDRRASWPRTIDSDRWSRTEEGLWVPA